MTRETFRRNTGLMCFLLLARHYGIDLTMDSLSHHYGIHDEAVSMKQLLRMGKDNDFKTRQTKLSWKKLFFLGNVFPLIARLRSGKHVIISGVRGEYWGGDVVMRSLQKLFIPSSGTIPGRRQSWITV